MDVTILLNNASHNICFHIRRGFAAPVKLALES